MLSVILEIISDPLLAMVIPHLGEHSCFGHGIVLVVRNKTASWPRQRSTGESVGRAQRLREFDGANRLSSIPTADFTRSKFKARRRRLGKGHQFCPPGHKGNRLWRAGAASSLVCVDLTHTHTRSFVICLNDFLEPREPPANKGVFSA